MAGQAKMTLGELMSHYRQNVVRMNVSEAARRAKLSRPYYFLIENGTYTNPTVAAADSIAQTLQIPWLVLIESWRETHRLEVLKKKEAAKDAQAEST